MRRAFAALALAALLQAGPAYAERDIEDQAACLAKQLRKHGGPEGGRATALKTHFDCFPGDPERFLALFETLPNAIGPLSADHVAHLELFFAARPAVGERAWSAKAIGVLTDHEWREGALDLYADLLALQLKERRAAPFDAIAKLDDAALTRFWQTLFGSVSGFKPDATVCAGRESSRACLALASLVVAAPP